MEFDCDNLFAGDLQILFHGTWRPVEISMPSEYSERLLKNQFLSKQCDLTGKTNVHAF